VWGEKDVDATGYYAPCRKANGKLPFSGPIDPGPMIGRRGSPETGNVAVGGSGSSLSRPEQTAGTSSKEARSETACWCLRTWALMWRLAAELSGQPLEGRIHLSILAIEGCDVFPNSKRHWTLLQRRPSSHQSSTTPLR
jgi:hypothetical protein